QLDAFEVFAIGAQRLLRIGAGLGVVEEGARHLAAGGPPQGFDAGHGAHAPVILAASGGGNRGTPGLAWAVGVREWGAARRGGGGGREGDHEWECRMNPSRRPSWARGPGAAGRRSEGAGPRSRWSGGPRTAFPPLTRST